MDRPKKNTAMSEQHHSNLLFDTSIYRLLFNKTRGRDNWNSLLTSILSFEPRFEELNHTIITSTALFLEAIGVPLKKINAELEGLVKDYVRELKVYRNRSDQEGNILDALFVFYRNFYRHHPLLDLTALEQRTNEQYTHFSDIHEHANPLFLLSVRRWLDAYKDQEAWNTLAIELAFDAMGRFSDACRPYCSSANSSRETSDRMNIAMIKCWSNWISQKINVSAYRFVSNIFENLNEKPTSSQSILPGASLGKLDDYGDCDIVHYCLFGAFIEGNKSQILHHPIKAFILEQEANSFIFRVKKYRIMLNLIRHTLQAELPLKSGLVYTVDPSTMRVIEQIDVASL